MIFEKVVAMDFELKYRYFEEFWEPQEIPKSGLIMALKGDPYEDGKSVISRDDVLISTVKVDLRELALIMFQAQWAC